MLTSASCGLRHLRWSIKDLGEPTSPVETVKDRSPTKLFPKLAVIYVALGLTSV